MAGQNSDNRLRELRVAGFVVDKRSIVKKICVATLPQASVRSLSTRWAGSIREQVVVAPYWQPAG